MLTRLFSIVTGVSFDFQFLVKALLSFLALAFVAAVWFKFNSLNDNISTLTQQKTELAESNDKLKSTNETNQLAIEKMQKDFKEQELILSAFRTQKTKDDKKLSDLSSKISSYGSNTDGPIAKVLKDTIIGIYLNEEVK